MKRETHLARRKKHVQKRYKIAVRREDEREHEGKKIRKKQIRKNE